MGESFLKTLGLKVVHVIKTLSTCKALLMHLSTGFTMATWKLLKKCQCSECIDVGGSDGCDWDTISYRGHHAHVFVGTATTSFPSMSPNAVAAASDELFISIFTMVELQHSHHQQILLLTHQLHSYLHHFTLTMHLHSSKLNWQCPFLQRYWMMKMMSHPSLLGLVLILNTETPWQDPPLRSHYPWECTI